MGSNSKSSAAQQDNYYGTLAGAVCIGPVAELVAVILGGKYWYKPSSPLLRSSANASGYSEIVDTRAGARTGKLRFYWGTETQATDPVLIALQGANNVPPYAGVCYFVLIDFFFGTSFGSAPNLEFIVRRAPNQAVVDGAAAALDSNQQANPVAMAAEVATAWHGLDLASAVVDANSLQDLADEIQGNAARRPWSTARRSGPRRRPRARCCSISARRAISGSGSARPIWSRPAAGASRVRPAR